ncbi:MAG: hypothetical protein KDA73_07370 [Rhodobacteraceae bacterium]|nr:hypothetical protein [Paracoccaceae bacterium]
MAERTARLLTSHWRLAGSIEEVSAILRDVAALPRWWGQVYLEAEEVAPGDDAGLGRQVRFLSRGWLPYTLRWEATVIAADPPRGWTIAASGDLTGEGRCRLAQDGEIADIRYDWRVDVEKPALKVMAPLLWPVYSANHRWAMARGREGLEREIRRRRAGVAAGGALSSPPS